MSQSPQDSTPEKEPPHNIEAEQQLLGAILSKNALFERIDGMVSEKDFYEPIHAEVFEEIRSRIMAGQIASPVTLAPHFSTHRAMSEIGGKKYLIQLMAGAVASFAIKDYAQIVLDQSLRRQILGNVLSATEELTSGRGAAAEVAFTLESSLGAITSKSAVKPLIRSHLSAITGALREINDAYSGAAQVGVSTGLPQLDRKIQNLRPGNLVILAGRPGMGKTTVAQSIAFHVAKNGGGVHFASLEMSGEELGKRFLSRGLAEKGILVPYTRMIGGNLSEKEMRHVVAEAQEQQALQMVIGERDVREIQRLRASVRRAKQQMEDSNAPLKLVVVDYVQRMSDEKARSFHERIARATDMLKTIAMEFEVPVMALAQLNREVERREPPVPMLADLKESGSLEEDADVVIFCYREVYYLARAFEQMDPSDKNYFEMKADIEASQRDLSLIVAKQRSGPTGSVEVFMDAPFCYVTADRSEQPAVLI